MPDHHRQEFKDHFSGHAAEYARHRPGYPRELFEWLARVAPATGTAWDAACGNGQAALGLAEHFRHVVASDASTRQLRNAAAHPAVSYLAARAEAGGLRDGCVDLVTVAQAAHWFDMPSFAAEAQRVARPGGVIAVWCYVLARVAPSIDEVVREFYDDTLGPFWPPERDLVEGGYRGLDFPFSGIEPPSFRMTACWTLPAFIDYLGTWSAYRRYLDRRRDDPLPALKQRLSRLWGEGPREVTWPLHLRAGVRNG